MVVLEVEVEEEVILVLGGVLAIGSGYHKDEQE